MSDFLADLLAGGKGIIQKEVTVDGKTGTVHFRRITAGERQQLLKGQKVSRQGGATHYELDLALNEEQKHKLVLYSVVTAEGKPYFKDIDAVRSAEAKTVNALYKVAEELIQETADEGKA